MKEILDNYDYPVIKNNAIVSKNKNNGSTIYYQFKTNDEAKSALKFARFCQYVGILLLDKKTVIKLPIVKNTEGDKKINK